MSDRPDTPRQPDPSLGGSAVDQAARNQTIIVETDAAPPDEEDVVETLRRQLADLEGSGAEEKKAREAAERRAADAERARQDAESRAQQAGNAARQTAADSQRTAAEAQLDSVKNALELRKGVMTGHKAAYAAAMAEGDFTKAADIQADMAVAGGQIAQLESGQAALEQRIKETPPQDTGRQSDQPQPSEQDRRESFIRGQPPKVQDWLRSSNGDRYFNDRAFQQKVAAAAQFAQNVKNISPDSQDYISYIEEQVGLREPTPPPTPQTQATPPAGRNAEDRRMTAAPAGGSTGGSVRSNADGSTTVYLTPGDKETARLNGLTDAEFARHKRDLLNEGLIGPGARNR